MDPARSWEAGEVGGEASRDHHLQHSYRLAHHSHIPELETLEALNDFVHATLTTEDGVLAAYLCCTKAFYESLCFSSKLTLMPCIPVHVLPP